MNKTASIIITLALVVGVGIVFMGGSKNDTNSTVQSTQNVEIRDGVQYVTVDAKAGYSPKISTAKAGIPTKLIVKTNGTYDCSASLVIRSVGFQKILQPTGEEVIDLGIPKSGDKVQGVCGMGMYNFQIKVN
jgi:plastocyanin domain-containing protein